MAKLALALALAPAVTAFAPVAAPKAATKLDASIADTLATMEGPEIFWGSDGVLLGHDEADIKGYDNFDQLAAALTKEGIDLSGGEYTLLAPANSAFDKHNAEVGTPIDAAVLKYHVIEGKKTMDASTRTRRRSTAAPSRRTASSARTGSTAPSSASSRRARPSPPTGRRTSSATTASSRPSTRSSCRAPTRARGKRAVRLWHLPD